MWKRLAMKEAFKKISKNDMLLYVPFAAVVLIYAAVMAWLFFFY